MKEDCPFEEPYELLFDGDPEKFCGGVLRTPATFESYHQWYLPINVKNAQINIYDHHECPIK